MKKNLKPIGVWDSYTLKKTGRIMRCILIFLFASTLNLIAADSFSQKAKISLTGKSASLESVMGEIEKQSEYVFLFSKEVIDINAPIEISAKDQNVEEVLDKIFQSGNIEYRIIENKIILSTKSESRFTQQDNKVTVTGKVTDNKGEPIPGVNVFEKANMVNGVITGIDGSYTITLANPEAVLSFSFIGFIGQDINVAGRSSINITLSEEFQQVDEVLVVAYGTAKKESFTGSAELVQSEVLEQTSSNMVANALVGRVAGVQVANSTAEAGTTAKIRIRGNGSFTASSEPLYVVDGVAGAPVPDNNDIENLTILKDAAAASLYGSRAANGVIIITTKKGKGDVSFNVKYTNTTSWKSPDNFDMMGTDDYMAKTWEGLYNRSHYIDGNTKEDAIQYAHDKLIEVTGSNPYAQKDESGNYLPLEQPFDDNGVLNPNAKLMYETDWLDEAYRVATTHNFHVSANKGSEKSNLYTSLSYYDQDGIVIENNYKRLSGIINCDVKVNDFFEYGFNTNMKYSEGRDYNSDLLKHAYQFNPTITIHELDENYQPKVDGKGNPVFNWKNPIYNDYNIHGQLYYNEDGYESTSMYGAPYIKLTPFDGLTVSGRASARFRAGNKFWFNFPDHAGGVPKNGLSNKNSWEDKLYTGLALATYSKSFQSHSIEVKAAYEVEEFESTEMSATAKGYPLWETSTELSSGEEPDEVTSGTIEDSRIGYLFSMDYGFSDRYYVSGSFRRDGSSRFGPDNRWGNFWSVGATWRLTEEAFMENVAFVDNLKLRASYGVNGNDGIGNYKYHTTYGLSNTYNDRVAATFNRFGNEQLGWESNENLTIAVEFGMFNRLRGTVEYYDRISSDLLLSKSYPRSSGVSTRYENVGELQNTGFELALDFDAVYQGLVKWRTGLTLTHNVNEITKLAEGNYWDGQIYRAEGLSMYNLRMKDWAGVDRETGAPLWYRDVVDSEGNPTGERETTDNWDLGSYYDKGDTSPLLFGAWNNEVSFKNFDFSFQVYYSIGGQAYNDLKGVVNHDGAQPSKNLASDAKNSWSETNKDASFPMYVYNDPSKAWYRSSRFLEDLDYVKLKTLTLGYNFSRDVVEKIKLKGARIYVMGENLLTLTNFSGYDPELDLNGTPGYGVPPATSVSFGVNVTF